MPKLGKGQPLILGFGLECGFYPSAFALAVYDKPSDIVSRTGMCMILASITTIICQLCIWLAKLYFHFIPNRKCLTISFDKLTSDIIVS